MSGAWVVLPTFNEAENVEAIVRAALDHLAPTGAAHHVLVVDDNSPDGTGAIADRLAAELEQVEVLHRPRKQGLGRAYLAGFDHALRRGADLLLEMDADFSHDPADLPRLIAAAGAADLVLGSRYVPGGGVTDWASCAGRSAAAAPGTRAGCSASRSAISRAASSAYATRCSSGLTWRGSTPTAMASRWR